MATRSAERPTPNVLEFDVVIDHETAFDFTLPLGNRPANGPFIESFASDELITCHITAQSAEHVGHETYVLTLEISANTQAPLATWTATYSEEKDYWRLLNTLCDVTTEENPTPTFYDLYALLTETSLMTVEHGSHHRLFIFPSLPIVSAELMPIFQFQHLPAYAKVHLTFDWQGQIPEMRLVIIFPDKRDGVVMSYIAPNAETFELAEALFLKYLFHPQKLEDLTVKEVTDGITAFSSRPEAIPHNNFISFREPKKIM